MILGSFVPVAIAALAAFALVLETFDLSFNSARLAVVLVILIALHLVKMPRLVFVREAAIYGCFLAYMVLQLLWTRDAFLALNTLVPAANFILVLVLLGSLAEFHGLRETLVGAVTGFLAGAILYFLESGFPLRYPPDFSYNAVAGMYLFGLVASLLLATLSRSRGAPLTVAAMAAMLVVATTSIKTNLGILLGALTAIMVHLQRVSGLLRRNAILVFAAVAVLFIAIASNDVARAAISRGSDRVALGIEILRARENRAGYSAFERREAWQRAGIAGWIENPVFGNGVEAFRERYGYTSHASHVDILYNSGAIGFALFYGVFASMFMRLYRAQSRGLEEARIVVLGATVCYLFMSFAGNVHQLSTLAAFIALGAAILRRA